MKKQYYLLLIIAGLITLSSFAQDAAPKLDGATFTNKGKIYVFWGWNRGWYADSDIRFQGDDYDFKLDNVQGTDRQSPFDLGLYFNPSTITIPQTNLRIGYFINENIDISFGVDHMKYVMVTGQETTITGEIKNKSDYEGTYNNDEFIIAKDFLEFEHSDGLNYLNFEITYNQNLLKAVKLKSNTNKIELNYLLGFGIGAMMPKSNVTLMNNERNDEFHIAGYAFAAKTGINLTFYRLFFLRTEYKAGFTDLTDIRTTQHESDRAYR